MKVEIKLRMGGALSGTYTTQTFEKGDNLGLPPIKYGNWYLNELLVKI